MLLDTHNPAHSLAASATFQNTDSYSLFLSGCSGALPEQSEENQSNVLLSACRLQHAGRAGRVEEGGTVGFEGACTQTLPYTAP